MANWFSISFDFSGLQSSVNAVSNFIRVSAIKIVADIEIETIIENAGKGLDASNKAFPEWGDFYGGDSIYSPSQQRRRKAKGKQTGRKDLRIDGALLEGMILDGDVLTVKPELQSIAEGQMSHPRWKYHHIFLAHNDTATSKQERAVAREMERVANYR